MARDAAMTPPRRRYVRHAPRRRRSRKRYEMVFEYVPTSDQPTEAMLRVSHRSARYLDAVFVRGMRDGASVSFDAASVNFGKVLVGAKHRRS